MRYRIRQQPPYHKMKLIVQIKSKVKGSEDDGSPVVVSFGDRVYISSLGKLQLLEDNPDIVELRLHLTVLVL